MLAKSPDIGTNRSDLFDNAMSFLVGSHIIFYIKNSQLNANIEIARVLHQSMDFEKYFL